MGSIYRNPPIEKLKQLDRIEFLLRRDKLERDHSGSIFISSMYTYATILFVVTISGFLLYDSTHFSSVGLALLNVVPLIAYVMGLGLAISLLVDLAGLISFVKKRRELYQEFFNIEVKSKEREHVKK